MVAQATDARCALNCAAGPISAIDRGNTTADCGEPMRWSGRRCVGLDASHRAAAKAGTTAMPTPAATAAQIASAVGRCAR